MEPEKHKVETGEELEYELNKGIAETEWEDDDSELPIPLEDFVEAIEKPMLELPVIGSSASKVLNGKSCEDRCVIGSVGSMKYLAVFDGHGGGSRDPTKIDRDHMVLYLENNLHSHLAEKLSTINTDDTEAVCKAITDVFIETDKLFYHNDYLYGSKAAIVLISDKHIYQITAGDKIISESVDCTPEREGKRIEKAGGWVSLGRVNTIMAVSRSFGDFEIKIDQGYEPYDEY